jgi:hypothetical protein
MELNDPNIPDVIVRPPDYSSSLKLHVLPMEDKDVHYPSKGSFSRARYSVVKRVFDLLF